jgi:glutamine amidotransferase
MSLGFCIYTSDPNLIACELERLAEHAALSDGERTNSAGMGSYAGDEVLLQHYSKANLPRQPTDLSPPHRSEALLYQAQLLSPGMSLEEEGQPFRFRQWFFCLTGAVEGFASFKAQLASELPPYLRHHVRGQGAGQAAFALFLKYLREAGKPLTQELDPSSVASALGKVARRLGELALSAGSTRVLEIGLWATHPQMSAVLRSGELPLYYTLLEGTDRCDRCGLPGRSLAHASRLRAHMQRRTVAVASKLLRNNGWIEVPNGKVVTAHHRLGLQIL